MSSPGSHQEQGRSNGKQFDSVTEADKTTIETVLFLMDKFAVGDAFIHELSMVVDGMPKSYLIKQCRDKLNSTCSVKPIPGGTCGAQVSNKLKRSEHSEGKKFLPLKLKLCQFSNYIAVALLNFLKLPHGVSNVIMSNKPANN